MIREFGSHGMGVLGRAASGLAMMMPFFQSVFFAYATYFFTNKLAKSSLKNFAFWTSMIITFNPTLSLSSLSIGYEAPIAACFMMIAGIIWENSTPTFDKKFWLSVAYVGSWFALATFMQPRFLLIAIIIAVFWALRAVGNQNQIRIVCATTFCQPLKLVQVYAHEKQISFSVGLQTFYTLPWDEQ